MTPLSRRPRPAASRLFYERLAPDPTLCQKNSHGISAARRPRASSRPCSRASLPPPPATNSPTHSSAGPARSRAGSGSRDDRRVPHDTILNFSISNPSGDGQGFVPALLRRMADAIEAGGRHRRPRPHVSVRGDRGRGRPHDDGLFPPTAPASITRGGRGRPLVPQGAWTHAIAAGSVDACYCRTPDGRWLSASGNRLLLLSLLRSVGSCDHGANPGVA
jgi:hypothetical protein